MPERDTHAAAAHDTPPMHPNVAFEAEDVSVGGVERAGLGLGIVVIIVLCVVGLIFHSLTSEQPVGTPEIAAGVSTTAHALPPAPRMQGLPGDTVTPQEQQREFQAAAAAQLHSYGWMDGHQSVAHIPIEDAMDRLVKNGLPQAAPPAAAATKKKTP